MEGPLRNLFARKGFWLFLAVVLLIVLLVSTSGTSGGLNVLRNVLSVPLTPLRQGYSAGGGGVRGFFSDLSTMREAQRENAELRQEIRTLQALNQEMAELKRQNDEFRKLLNFKEQYADYGFLGSLIIGKDPGNWFDVFTINRGVKDGLKKGSGYPVIAADGLVGRVSHVGVLSSEVVSLIDMDSTVSVRVARTRDLFVVRGDITLKQEGLCRLDYIPPNADLKPGDVLETSGMGEVYPKGIRVGVVERIVWNQGQFDGYAIVDPSVDFNRLEEVEVLTPNGEAHASGTAEAGEVP
jgi:rod shape-determining protein MreC